MFSIKTTPFDKKHYPATNQAHYCWQKYNGKETSLDTIILLYLKQLTILNIIVYISPGILSLEYVLCVRKNEGDEDACKAAKQMAWSICPDEWVNKHNEYDFKKLFGIEE